MPRLDSLLRADTAGETEVCWVGKSDSTWLGQWLVTRLNQNQNSFISHKQLNVFGLFVRDSDGSSWDTRLIKTFQVRLYWELWDCKNAGIWYYRKYNTTHNPEVEQQLLWLVELVVKLFTTPAEITLASTIQLVDGRLCFTLQTLYIQIFLRGQQSVKKEPEPLCVHIKDASTCTVCLCLSALSANTLQHSCVCFSSMFSCYDEHPRVGRREL